MPNTKKGWWSDASVRPWVQTPVPQQKKRNKKKEEEKEERKEGRREGRKEERDREREKERKKEGGGRGGTIALLLIQSYFYSWAIINHLQFYFKARQLQKTFLSGYFIKCKRGSIISTVLLLLLHFGVLHTENLGQGKTDSFVYIVIIF
jgi:hypothetical protein